MTTTEKWVFYAFVIMLALVLVSRYTGTVAVGNSFGSNLVNFVRSITGQSANGQTFTAYPSNG